jgi:hypothetical protein
MRGLLRKLLQILDGTPAVYGKRQAGQSMVELALVTPLLIILLAGLVEIGWFANNYLNILDVTRAGARRATVLVDDQAPDADAWLAEFTFVPKTYLNNPLEIPYQMEYLSADPVAEENARKSYRYEANDALGQSACNAAVTDRLFYNEVVCTMLISLDPLVLNRDNDIDDIIITGYSLEMVNAAAHPIWLPAAARPIATDVPQLVVAGRYPALANECDVVETAPGIYGIAAREPRDPFDFNMSGDRDDGSTPLTIDNDNDFAELVGYDGIGTTFLNAEKQVGFSLYGNHKIPGTQCVGSEWTMREIETLMNISAYEDLTDPAAARIAARAMMPGQGMVMVEMYWEHEMLLQIPVLSPVFTAVGNAEGKMVINVWAAFPLPSVEPYIIFPA